MRQVSSKMISFLHYNNILESADTGLAAKAKKSGVSIGILRKVYKRGVAAWNSGHRPGTTPQQWGMARVNSYITKGKGTYGGADKDLREETDAVKSLESSLNSPSSYDAIDQMMQTIAKESGISPKELHNNFVKKHGKTPDDYAKGMKEAAVPKDSESGLPKKYVAGLSPSTAKARAAHFDAADKLSDKDPEANKPAPGDATAKTKESKHTKKYRDMFGEDMEEEIFEACWVGYKQVGIKKKGDKMVPDCVKEEDIDEAAVDAKGHKSSTGGLTQKGRDAYNAKGANLQAPVTTAPSKLKAGSKSANRRKSFCARMSGVKGPMKKPNGKPTRKKLALDKWNC